MHGFADSDYACDSDTHRSTSGYLFLLNGSAVSWKTKSQEAVALSSTEAEFNSLSRAGQHAVSLRTVISPQHNPAIIYEDNLMLRCEPALRSRMKNAQCQSQLYSNPHRYWYNNTINQAVHCPTTPTLILLPRIF